MPDQAGADDLAVPDCGRNRVDCKAQCSAKPAEVMDISLPGLSEAEIFSDHDDPCPKACAQDATGELGGGQAGEGPIEGSQKEGGYAGVPDSLHPLVECLDHADSSALKDFLRMGRKR
jgi:hypothetical protein